jgi:hypothetical protein
MFGNSFYNNQYRDVSDNDSKLGYKHMSDNTSKLGNIASLLSSKTVHIENMEVYIK